MASKINEAKDCLMTQVEDNPDLDKKEEESNDIGEESFERYIREQAILRPKESEKVYLDVMFGKTTEMTKEEFDSMYERYIELEDKEVEEEENLENGNYEGYEIKDNKNNTINLDELNGCELDKDSEFYKKYKKEIENFEFDDLYHPMNNFEFKIIKKKDKDKDNIKV
jgi:hypothetical protein